MLNFSEQLRGWRLKQGLSQTELAQRARIPRPNLVDLETGRRDCTITTLARLAGALEISPGRLIDENPHEFPRWHRHQIDTIAKNLLEQQPSLHPDLREIHKLLLPVVFPILRCAGLPSPENPSMGTALRYHRRDAELKFGKSNVDRILRRVHKLVANRS